ncbi:alpha/beta hydrolase fold-3 domain-containing protein [Xylariaceae sp. FL1019]|nr:alpha/beta hydrolase fold-3 domain-containing protein [Xylariaceae sp. FL1019]
MSQRTNSSPLASYQPLRTLFQLAFIGSIVARLPLWLTTSLISHLRPHPKWTFKQALMLRITYTIVDMNSRIGVTEPLSVKKGKDDRFQVVEAFDSSFYVGELAHHYIKPVPVGCTWFPQAPKRDIASKTVVLYLHGGAFVLGDGRQGFCGFPARMIVEHGNVDFMFSVQYRLSGYSGANSFPSAVQDALTTYLFLLTTLHIPADRIVLAGDSAGGNLAIALLRYIKEYGRELKLPPPKCCLLFSPWTAPYDLNIESNSNFSTDWLPRSLLRWGTATYGSGQHIPETNRYITPLRNPFQSGIPIFVNYGALEIFRPNIIRWAQEMEQGGNNIELHCEDDAPHDTMLLGGLLGFESSARNVAVEVGSFVSKH